MKNSFFYILTLSLFCQLASGMERDPSPMRVDERAGPSERVSPTPPSSPEVNMGEAEFSQSLDLKTFSKQLEEAEQQIDFNRVYSLYKEFIRLDSPKGDAFWEEEVHKMGAIKWGRSWKDAVGGHLFLKAAVNEPHMSLIATVLQELVGARVDNWEEIYEGCRQRVSQIIKTHPYFRRRTGLYALGATYTFNHPIGQLLFIEAMEQLESDEDKRDLARARPLVALKFKSSQGGLRDFLTFYPDRILDLQGEDLRNPDKLREYADFGLPHYRIMLAECLQKRINWGQLDRKEVATTVKEFFPYYLEAGKEGDFEGYFLLSQLVGIILEDSKKLASTSFLQGNRKPFSYFPKKDKKIMGYLLDLYKELKKFLVLPMFKR